MKHRLIFIFCHRVVFFSSSLSGAVCVLAFIFILRSYLIQQCRYGLCQWEDKRRYTLTHTHHSPQLDIVFDAYANTSVYKNTIYLEQHKITYFASSRTQHDAGIYLYCIFSVEVECGRSHRKWTVKWLATKWYYWQHNDAHTRPQPHSGDIEFSLLYYYFSVFFSVFAFFFFSFVIAFHSTQMNFLCAFFSFPSGEFICHWQKYWFLSRLYLSLRNGTFHFIFCNGFILFIPLTNFFPFPSSSSLGIFVSFFTLQTVLVNLMSSLSTRTTW